MLQRWKETDFEKANPMHACSKFSYKNSGDPASYPDVSVTFFFSRALSIQGPRIVSAFARNLQLSPCALASLQEFPAPLRLSRARLYAF